MRPERSPSALAAHTATASIFATWPRAAAMKKCSGATCKVVADIRRGCAAMAIDAKRPCGSFGWAINAHLGKAENASLRRCYEFGGRDCVVRAWACDEKG